MREKQQILGEFDINGRSAEGYPVYSAQANNLLLVLEALLDVRDILAAAAREDQVALKRAAGG